MKTIESKIKVLIKDSQFTYVSHTDFNVCLKDKYGLYEIPFKSLNKGCFPSIKSSLNKTEIFINRAVEVHGYKYEYLDVYKTMKTPFKMKCKVHENFIQTPDNHLKGKGCLKCGHIKTSINNKRTRMAFYKLGNCCK